MYCISGPEAVEAVNVFYYLTYPGSVNWNAITDNTQLQVQSFYDMTFGSSWIMLIAHHLSFFL